MPTYIAFLRAVNVGNRWVKMELLRNHLGANGFAEVATHIQSGNVRVTTPLRSSAKVERTLHDVISDEFGFDVPTIVRTPAELRTIAERADAIDSPLSDGARRYVIFMSGDVSPAGIDALHAWDAPGEAARVLGREVVLFLDTTFHTAKLTNARIEKLTGCVGTARDIKVVRALAEKWGD